MQLVNISKTGDTYTVKALKTFKLLGLQLFSKVTSYTISPQDKDWCAADKAGDISEKTKIKLNKWLRDHQRFIEKS